MSLHSTVDLCKIAVGHHLGRLVADTNLEASWAPVDELNRALGLESCDSTVSILGNEISTVEQASSHILAVAGIALDHLVVRLEARHGDFLGGVGLVRCLCSRDNRSIGDKREVDARVWDEVGLELVQIDVEGAVETERRGDGGND